MNLQGITYSQIICTCVKYKWTKNRRVFGHAPENRQRKAISSAAANDIFWLKSLSNRNVSSNDCLCVCVWIISFGDLSSKFTVDTYSCEGVPLRKYTSGTQLISASSCVIGIWSREPPFSPVNVNCFGALHQVANSMVASNHCFINCSQLNLDCWK